MTCDEKFLICPPRFYGVEYVINPWMEGNVGRTSRQEAARQWEAFREALAAHAGVELIEPVSGLPDMPFTANGGIVYEDIFIPGRFRFPQRQPEEEHFVNWFRQRGYRIVEVPGQATFEGEGDALFQPGEPLVWTGYGVRTSLQFCRWLADLLHMEVFPLRLIDERFYHLDTCFCPLTEGRVIYYPNAFDRDSVAAIASHVSAANRFEVSATDAVNFGCNAVVTGRTFITNFASDALRAQLAGWGYQVVVSPLSQFILAGGAAKCLVLGLIRQVTSKAVSRPPLVSGVRERHVEVEGHLLDRGLMNQILDCITKGAGSFDIESFRPAAGHDQDSWARLRVVAPNADRLDAILVRLMQLGVRVADDETDAHVELVTQPGVAPQDFYSTTIFPTDVRVHHQWLRAKGQRMDAVLVVGGLPDTPRVQCRLIRDLAAGDRVVCGINGVRIYPTQASGGGEAFGFMRAGVSSERRVELAVERIAWEMRRIRERGGKIVVVGGPVVIHTGGGPYLASLIRRGYVQTLLGGNGLAAHDIESGLFGTSLGVDMRQGTVVPGGHQHHLKAINLVRACGSIAHAVQQGLIRSGVMYECVKNRVPFALAGSIRDDGPLPETLMDLIEAQETYARLIEGGDLILMLGSMLHGIGVGNMTPAGPRLICVDISPAVVTKLTDRGSVDSVGIVTDVGLFLNLLDASLDAEVRRAEVAPGVYR